MAKRFAFGEPELGTHGLAEAGVPVHLLPGNHDRYSFRSERPWVLSGSGNTRFDEVFQDHWRGLPVRANAFPSFTAGGEVLHVVAADFTLKAADLGSLHLAGFGVLGQGCAYPEAVKELRVRTAQARASRKGAVIWAVHFPPKFEHRILSLGAACTLRHDDQLIQAAAKERIPLLIAGHTHIHRTYQVEALQIHSAGTSGTTAEDDGTDTTIHAIHLCVENGQLIGPAKIETHRFDSDDFSFKPDQGG